MFRNNSSYKEIARDLIKNAKSEEEIKAKNSYIITRIMWYLLGVYYLIGIILPRVTGNTSINTNSAFFIKFIVPIIVVIILEAAWLGKPWYDYLDKVKNNNDQ